jgi:8-oxo-dGTP diphosphatase
MLVHLVRHAVAESRSSWSLPDSARPLDERGRKQAAGLVGQRDWSNVRSIASSPAVRCLDTVAPLAAHLGLAVLTEERLGEGRDPSAVLAMIAEADRGDLVLCSHGDLIPEVLRLAESRGALVERPRKWAKGSTWTITCDDGEFVEAAYTPPPKN